MTPFKALRLRRGIPNYKVFEMLFEGANGSTSFPETYGATIITAGSVVVSTAQFNQGSASGYFPGSTSDYLSSSAALAAMDFGGGDFAIDIDIRPTTISGIHMLLTTRSSAGSDPGFLLWQTGAQVRFLAWGPSAGTVMVDMTGGTLVANTWATIHVQRVGDLWMMMQGTTVLAVASVSGSIASGGNALHIGRDPSTSGREYAGYMDRVLAYKGGGAMVGPAQFNPTGNAGTTALFLNNTQVNLTGSGNARLTTPKSSGVWQVEFEMQSDLDTYTMFGFGVPSTPNTGYPGASTHSSLSWGYWNRNGNKYNNGVAAVYGAAYFVSNVIGLVYDASAGTVTMYRNGVSQGVMASGITGPIVPMVGNGGSSSSMYSGLKTTLTYPVTGATQWNL